MRRLPSAALPICFSIVVLSSLSAQTGSSRVTVPSPTAASLGKVAAVPVGLYTGVPNISIPLFTVTGKTLQLPIGLRYAASGNRVEDIGGWIGLGWSLEAGGVITRTVRGKPDESQFGYYNTGAAWYDGNNWPIPYSATILRNIHDGQVDGDPDQFFFSFAGRSGQFVMGPVDMSGTIEYRTIPAQKLRIVPTFGTWDIASWEITTEDGTRYTFGAGGKEIHYDYTSGSITNNGESYSSSWYLTQITAPGGDQITLSYNMYTAHHSMGWYKELFSEIQQGNPPNCPPSQFYYNADYWMNPGRQLASIQSAAYTVTFVPGDTLRADALSSWDNARQEPFLDHITIATPTGTVLKSFKLKHDQYPGNRLRLTSVTEVGANNDSLPPHSFTYDGQTLPSRFSFAQDHWGYYNGKTLNTSFIPTTTHTACLSTCVSTVYPGADRTPDANYAQAGILTRITYPTGGYNEFVYEGNDYGRVSMGSGLPIDDTPQGVGASSPPFGGLQSNTFTPHAVGGAQTLPVHVALIMYVHTGFSNCGNGDPIRPCPWGEMLGQPVKWYPSGEQGQAPTYAGNQSYTKNLDLALVPGTTYTIQTSAAGYNVDIQIVATWNDRVYNTKKKGGGLRIVQLRTGDAMGNVDTTKYVYTLQADPTSSSGVVGLEPVYDFSYSGMDCSFYSRSSTSRLPLGSGTTGEIAYREVTVVHGGAGQFGSTLHTFRSISDVLDGLNNSIWPHAQRTSWAWTRGQEIYNTEYDAAGHPQHQVLSGYTSEIVNPADSRHYRGMSLYIYPFASDIGGIPVLYANPYEVIAGWFYQSSEVTTQYDPSGTNSISATKTFVYSNPNHLQLTEVQETNSDGTQRITRMKYPGDYATGGAPGSEAAALTAMQSVSPTGAHMPGVVVERAVSVRTGLIEHVVQAELTTFKEFVTGQFLPYKRYVLNSPSQLP